jgi:hypothetical protein
MGGGRVREHLGIWQREVATHEAAAAFWIMPQVKNDELTNGKSKPIDQTTN